MVMGVEAIAAWVPLGLRDEGTGLVIADLLHTDVSGQCEIGGTQIGTSCHVKLPSAYRDFFQWVPFFLPHRTSIWSLYRSLTDPYASPERCLTLQLGIT